jgi:hypothetical protein
VLVAATLDHEAPRRDEDPEQVGMPATADLITTARSDDQCRVLATIRVDGFNLRLLVAIWHRVLLVAAPTSMQSP